MYKFYYACIKNKFDNKSKLLFTDIDSLMYKIKSEDVYEDFTSDKELFDFSNYPTKLWYHDNSNKLVIRKMKEGTGSIAIEEFFGLKPMMSLFLADNDEHKK